jgi:hypothetical protein
VFRLIRSAVLVAALALGAATIRVAHLIPDEVHVAACGWSTPAGPGGQEVEVVATGPACAGLGGWLEGDADVRWSTAPPAGVGLRVARLHRGASTAEVWHAGPLARPLAEALAGALVAAGWRR